MRSRPGNLFESTGAVHSKVTDVGPTEVLIMIVPLLVVMERRRILLFMNMLNCAISCRPVTNMLNARLQCVLVGNRFWMNHCIK